MSASERTADPAVSMATAVISISTLDVSRWQQCPQQRRRIGTKTKKYPTPPTLGSPSEKRGVSRIFQRDTEDAHAFKGTSTMRVSISGGRICHDVQVHHFSIGVPTHRCPRNLIGNELNSSSSVRSPRSSSMNSATQLPTSSITRNSPSTRSILATSLSLSYSAHPKHLCFFGAVAS